MRLIPLIIVSLCIGCVEAPEPAAEAPVEVEPTTARELIAHLERIPHTESFTFEQETIFHGQGGETDTVTWYEAARPAQLRIDVAPVEEGNGYLFTDGKRYDFQGGELVNEVEEINPLLLVLSSVYSMPPDWSAQQLDSLGFDLGVFRETNWEERPIYIVGAEEGDLETPQFWIDKEHGYPVRIVQRVGPGGQALLDAQIGGHTRYDSGWIESEIMIYVNGNLVQEEYYQNIRPDVVLDDALFDPTSWQLETPYWE